MNETGGCSPCPIGTYQDSSFHSNIQCTNCTGTYGTKKDAHLTISGQMELLHLGMLSDGSRISCRGRQPLYMGGPTPSVPTFRKTCIYVKTKELGLLRGDVRRCNRPKPNPPTRLNLGMFWQGRATPPNIILGNRKNYCKPKFQLFVHFSI